jgi:hypothetical protein
LQEQKDGFEEAIEAAIRRKQNLSTPVRHSRRSQRELLCLALFATAEIGQREIFADQFEQLDVFRRSVEDRDSTHLSRICLPDNLSLINLLRLAASCYPGKSDELLIQIDAECRSLNLSGEILPLVPWNAQTTWFERSVMFPPGSAVGVPVFDTSRGVTNYFFYLDLGRSQGMAWATETAQEDLLQRIRKLVLGTGAYWNPPW